MLIESASIPKFRDRSQAGDDLFVVLPQRLVAVFDGATDAAGVLVDGATPGRFAASLAANAMVQIASSAQRGTLTPEQWLEAMNKAIRLGLAHADASQVLAASTAAIIEDSGDLLRFLIVGDSGIRINGRETFRFAKDIDVLYTAGRVAVFEWLRRQGHSGDRLEAATRELVFRGLGQRGRGLLDQREVAKIITTAQAACANRLQPDALEMIEQMLLCGIAGAQYQFCNRPDHSLGYGVLNGATTCGPDVLSFTRRKSEVHSVELFTDGYLTCPIGTQLADWEAEFLRVEQADPSKISLHPGVKGSSSEYFSDDRTVVTVHCISPDKSTR